jgi:hypothetical protein
MGYTAVAMALLLEAAAHSRPQAPPMLYCLQVSEHGMVCGSPDQLKDFMKGGQ